MRLTFRRPRFSSARELGEQHGSQRNSTSQVARGGQSSYGSGLASKQVQGKGRARRKCGLGVVQAMLFYVPCIVWRLLNWQSGICVDNVVTMAADSKNIHVYLPLSE